MDDLSRTLALRHQLERAALSAALKAQRRRAEAERLEREARVLRLRAKSKNLRPGPARRSPVSVRTAALISARKTREKFPFHLALEKAGLSPAEWARRQRSPRVNPETVRNWLKDPLHGGRRCPEVWAKRIEREFTDEKSGRSLVPARDSSWPSGIRWSKSK